MIYKLLKTDILYTSVGEPIKNGMLGIDENGIIASVGTDLSAEGVKVEYYEGALCAGFVNTHCHLELSHLKNSVSQQTGLRGFIEELQKLREAEESEVQLAIRRANAEMERNGIVAVGDISNGSSSFGIKKSSSIYYHTFVELFGFDPEVADSVFERGQMLKNEAESEGLSSTVVPHSPYSVSKKLFGLINSHHKKSTPISIHNQESKAENELYEKGEGKMMEMLSSFGLDTSSFQPSGSSSLSTYLNYLPKESPLLLVHNTFTNREDIVKAEEQHNNLFWCFCPKANLYIENRLPNIEQFVDLGVKCTLGTDSLASNDALSIWEEIQTIQQHFPSLELNKLIQWGTINGAEFLGLEKEYGSLEVGKKARINWIKNDVLVPLLF